MISYENIYKYSVPGSETPGSILGDVHRFRRVEREGFNAADVVDTRFFKLLFYFFNDEPDPNRVDWFNGGPSGLLSPTWLDNPTGDYYKYNSAWAYLKSNYEEERADALVQFVNLLSQISSESPWYFQSISGIDEALVREKWAVGEERKKISIKCMNDPVDHRIESLLSLYRSIVWSHVRKCEVLPSNLRKFDMGMFVFSGLFRGLIVKNDDNGNQSDWAQIGRFNDDIDRANYKYIEFHNCEIAMDSLKSGFSEMSNESGFEQEFTIDIYFDDCYEYEYNPFVMRSFGDFFLWDAWQTSRNESGEAIGKIDGILYSDERLKSIETNTLEDMNGRLNYFRYIESIKAQALIKNQDVSKNDTINKNPLKPFDDESIKGQTSQKKDTINKNPLKPLTDNLIGFGNAAVNTAIKSATSSVDKILYGSKRDNIYYKVDKGLINDINSGMKSIDKTIQGQINSLEKKVLGNINGLVRDSINVGGGSVRNTVQNGIDQVNSQVNSKIKNAGNIAGETIDKSFGDVKKTITNNLGNLYSGTEQMVGNIVGKNRLNVMKS